MTEEYKPGSDEVFDQTQLPDWDALQLQQIEQRRRSTFYRGVACFMGGVAVATSIFIRAGEAHQPGQLFSQSGTCKTPTEKAQHAVLNILNTYEQKDGEELEEGVAKAVGVDVIPATTNFFKILKAYDVEKAGKTRPFTDYLSLANNFMQERYGVTVRLATSEDLLISRHPYPTNAILESADAKNSLLNLYFAFESLPVQLIQKVGLKTIILGADIDEYAAYVSGTNPNAIVADISGEISDELWFHEFYHLLDAKECGAEGMQHDSAYTAPNGQDIYDKHQLSRMPLSLEEYTGELANAYANERASCDQLRTDAAHVVVGEDYGYKDAVEDKAVLGQKLLNPAEYFDVLSLEGAPLRQKFLVELARLYDFDPKSAEYFAKLADYQGHISHIGRTLLPDYCA